MLNFPIVSALSHFCWYTILSVSLLQSCSTKQCFLPLLSLFLTRPISVLDVLPLHVDYERRLDGVVGLMLPLALATTVRVPYTTSSYSDLGQVVNLSLSVV